jgi:hypothetical protein
MGFSWDLELSRRGGLSAISIQRSLNANRNVGLMIGAERKEQVREDLALEVGVATALFNLS